MATRCSKALVAVVIMAISAGAFTFRGGYTRTGRVEGVLNLSSKPRAVLSLGGAIISSPCIVGDTVYIGARDSSVYAIVGDRIVWSFKTGGWVDATPTWDHGRLYVSSRNGLIYVLDASSGDSLGVVFGGGTQCSSPLVHDTLIVFGVGGWAHDIKAQSLGAVPGNVWFHTNRQPVYSSPALNDSILTYGENGGSLTALHIRTGKKLWSYQTTGSVYMSTPAIQDSLVWFSPGHFDRHVYAVRLRNGELVWKNSSLVERMAKKVNPVLAKRLLGHSIPARKRIMKGLWRLHKARGVETETGLHALGALCKPRARQEAFFSFGTNATSSVSVGDHNVYAVHMEYGYPVPRYSITAYDKSTGTEQWTYSELRRSSMPGFCASPLVSDSMVIAGWGEGKLYGFDFQAGGVVWEDSLEGDIVSSPGAGANALYVGTTAGKFYAYDITTSGSIGYAPRLRTTPSVRITGRFIRVFSPNASRLSATIFDAAGRRVYHIEKSLAAKGSFTGAWSDGLIAHGIYFADVRLRSIHGETHRRISRLMRMQ